jgi:hypothetical protein
MWAAAGGADSDHRPSGQLGGRPKRALADDQRPVRPGVAPVGEDLQERSPPSNRSSAIMGRLRSRSRGPTRGDEAHLPAYTTSAKECSMRRKQTTPPMNRTATTPVETATVPAGTAAVSSNAHRKPSITPAIGFTP